MYRLAAILGLLLLLASCAATNSADDSRPHGWSIARPSPAPGMPDSIFVRLSKTPPESLTADQRAMLERETKMRARARRRYWIEAPLVIACFGAICFLGRYAGIGGGGGI